MQRPVAAGLVLSCLALDPEALRATWWALAGLGLALALKVSPVRVRYLYLVGAALGLGHFSLDPDLPRALLWGGGLVVLAMLLAGDGPPVVSVPAGLAFLLVVAALGLSPGSHAWPVLFRGEPLASACLLAVALAAFSIDSLLLAVVGSWAFVHWKTACGAELRDRARRRELGAWARGKAAGAETDPQLSEGVQVAGAALAWFAGATTRPEPLSGLAGPGQTVRATVSRAVDAFLEPLDPALRPVGAARTAIEEAVRFGLWPFAEPGWEDLAESAPVRAVEWDELAAHLVEVFLLQRLSTEEVLRGPEERAWGLQEKLELIEVLQRPAEAPAPSGHPGPPPSHQDACAVLRALLAQGLKGMSSW